MTKNRVVEMINTPASALLPHPENWRMHPREQQTVLRAMLDRIGFAVPIVAYRDGERLRIIDGHLRAEQMGDELVTVAVVDLDAEEARELLLTADPLVGLAQGDADRLAALIDAVDIQDAHVRAMLDHMQAAARAVSPHTGRGDPDVAPDPPDAPVARPGQIWALGRHRLMCGSATSTDDVAALFDGQRPSLMVTDPPYGVAYQPSWRSANRVGTVSNDDQADWREAWALYAGDVAYVWHASLHTAQVFESLEAAGFEHRALLIWVKPNHTFSRGHYHWQHEPCLYAVRKGARAHWIGDRSQSTVWRIEQVHGAAGEGDVTVHGAQKPVECMERPIRNHSGDVYDPFVGSGTTIIAAERQDRTCYAMELDPSYVDVARMRWEAYTGGTATLIHDSAPAASEDAATSVT